MANQNPVVTFTMENGDIMKAEEEAKKAAEEAAASGTEQPKENTV